MAGLDPITSPALRPPPFPPEPPKPAPASPVAVATPATPPAPSPPPLAPSVQLPDDGQMTDADRRTVQGALLRLGYYDLPVDGIFGLETRAAMRMR
jgi:peptidoglycan hydrolase-like protein with peptidoglycan-binding domain